MCNQLKLKCVGVEPKVGDSVCQTNNISKCWGVMMDAYGVLSRQY